MMGEQIQVRRVLSGATAVVLFVVGCGPSEAQVAAVQKQIEAKSNLATTEIERLQQDTGKSLEQLFQHPTPDGLVSDIRHLKEQTDLATRRCCAVLDDLDGFLTQNAEYDQALNLPKVRAACMEQRRVATAMDRRIASMANDVRDVTVSVKAGTGDWEPAGLTASPGDILVFGASGAWSVGSWAGACGPGGVAGYEKYSLDTDYAHGALLMRCGDGTLAGGAASGAFVIKSDGAISLRCNDKKATDNRGAISVRLVLAPMSQAKAKK